MVKLVLQEKFHKTDLVICSHSRERKTPSYSLINTVPMHLNERRYSAVVNLTLYVLCSLS